MLELDFTPHRLANALSKLATLMRNLNFQEAPDRLERCRRRLGQGLSLKEDEMYILLRNAHLLQEMEIEGLTKQLNRTVASSGEGAKLLAAKFLEDFAPRQGVDVALNCDLFSLSEKAPRELREKNVKEVSSLVSLLVSNDTLSSFIERFVRAGGESSGIEVLASVLRSRADAVVVYDEVLRVIIDSLHECLREPKLLLPHFEETASMYLQLDPSYSTKLVSTERSIGYMLAWVKQNELVIGLEFPSLLKLRKEQLDLNKAIKTLSQKDYSRGEYWQSQISRADRVVVNTFKFGQLVGVAMWYGDYVIAEFGPTGNAAHIYERTVFEEEVLHTDDWKQSSLVVEDIQLSERVPPGMVYHHKGWQERVSQLLDRLLGG